MWKLIDKNTPKDRLILVYAPPYDDLPELYSVCMWHKDAGFCIDELREPTLWCEIPKVTERAPV